MNLATTSYFNFVKVYPKSDPNGELFLMMWSLFASNTSPAAPAASIPGSGSDQESSFMIGNPYLFERALDNLDKSIGNVIDIIDEEKASQGVSSGEVRMKEKLEGWRDDIANLQASGGKVRQTSRTSGAAADELLEGGLFVD